MDKKVISCLICDFCKGEVIGINKELKLVQCTKCGVITKTNYDVKYPKKDELRKKKVNNKLEKNRSRL